MGYSEEQMWGMGACCLCIVLPTIIMLACSFSKLDANEVALRKHRHFGYKASSEVETNGLHYVGLWHSFAIISKTDSFAEYSITAFTENVIQVRLDVSIQYQVEPTYQNLYNIIFDYDDMPAYFNSRVRDAVRRGVQSLHSDVLYSNRNLVTSTLLGNVRKSVTESGYVLNNLQVTEIVVPNEMQQAIDDLVSAKLDERIATNERDKLIQQATNAKNQAVHDATIATKLQVQTAVANYNASLILLDAQLHKLQKDVDNLKDLTMAYQEKYQALTPMQIMELVKTHKYNDLVFNLAANGDNKIILDHKPSAIGEIGDAMAARLEPAASPTENR